LVFLFFSLFFSFLARRVKTEHISSTTSKSYQNRSFLSHFLTDYIKGSKKNKKMISSKCEIEESTRTSPRAQQTDGPGVLFFVVPLDTLVPLFNHNDAVVSDQKAGRRGIFFLRGRKKQRLLFYLFFLLGLRFVRPSPTREAALFLHLHSGQREKQTSAL